MKFKNYLLIVLAFLAQLTFSQENKAVNQKSKYSFPFQLTEDNNFSVQAILNKKDTVNLMFHTAASSITLTEAAIKKITSLDFSRTDSVKSWGGGNSSRFSQSNSLQIGEMKWDKLPIWENINSGPKTDGKFGLELFENKVIAIDFDKKMISIYDELPKQAKKYEKLKLIYEDEMMFLEANCTIGENSFKNKFLIHSGYAGSVLFDDQFVANHKLAEKLNVIGIKELKDSFGNSIKTKKAILPTLTIGNEKLANVPVGFFEGALGRQKMSLIGGDILKRFNMIIDAKRAYIYLKASHLQKVGYTNV